MSKKWISNGGILGIGEQNLISLELYHGRSLLALLKKDKQPFASRQFEKIIGKKTTRDPEFLPETFMYKPGHGHITIWIVEGPW